MLKVRSRGNYDKTANYLKKASVLSIEDILNRYGPIGVELLSRSTPMDTGVTARSWGYKIEKSATSTYLVFYNTNVQGGWANVAILLQYGHATGTGGYVQGQDYINPALKPFFDALVDDIGEEVARL